MDWRPPYTLRKLSIDSISHYRGHSDSILYGRQHLQRLRSLRIVLVSRGFEFFGISYTSNEGLGEQGAKLQFLKKLRY